jgi:hypothetical protein
LTKLKEAGLPKSGAVWFAGGSGARSDETDPEIGGRGKGRMKLKKWRSAFNF